MLLTQYTSIPGFYDLYDHTGRQVYYQQGFFGQGINVGIVDSGCNNHNEFGNRLKFVKDFGGNIGDPKDYDGHGTMMTGILAGVHGMLPLANIYHAKVQRPNGLTYLDEIAEALFWLSRFRDKNNNPIDVITVSLSSSSKYGDIEEAINACTQNNILVFCSMGNTSSYTLRYPASLKGAIAVSAVDSYLKLAKYSSYGQTIAYCQHGTNIVAPTNKASNDYSIATGTSPATPLVAGIAGLIRCKHKLLNNKRQSNTATIIIMNQLAVDLGEVGHDSKYGFGFITLDPSAVRNWSIEIPIDKTYLLDGGIPIPLDQAAYINPDTDRTVLPIRAVAEALDYDVLWNDLKKIVTLRRKHFTPKNTTIV